ncbi:MAG: phage holin family protein [Coriobacteriia bacterium]
MWWRILFRWLITAIAVAAAVLLIPGISVAHDSNTIITIVAVGAILALINVVIRPILQFLSCGCIMATLGLFTLVINAGMLWLSSWMAQNWFGIGFRVDGFWPAFWGGLVISIVSFLLSIFVPDSADDSRSN